MKKLILILLATVATSFGDFSGPFDKQVPVRKAIPVHVDPSPTKYEAESSPTPAPAATQSPESSLTDASSFALAADCQTYTFIK